ncbi:hypothetical protein A2706_01760 [Candidatus Peribacteria bacterium RIFCSPHIGHO2_01_FULL_51_35]|nr:MAG: hypothetical protein A2706_01760 [Candidatus Peribacteria bacterium RIFCSPHIGHO2_01_FULL_51_35]
MHFNASIRKASLELVRETSEEHGTIHQAGAEWAMLYSSEGLISACGLVPSVFGRARIVEVPAAMSRIGYLESREKGRKCFGKE